MRKQTGFLISAALCLFLAGCSSSDNAKKKAEESMPTASTSPTPAPTPAPTPTPTPESTPPPDAKAAAKVEPKKAAPAKLPEKAPALFKVNLETSKGLIVIEVHKDWAPIGAQHFYELVNLKYYNDVRFFRVISGFMAQFGMNGDPAINATWASANIKDDPVTQHNTRGMVTFAQTGMPNSRSTQLFINLVDRNTFLDSQGFAPIGQITTGMDVVDQLYAGYGEGAPGGAGPSQQLIGSKGNAYLEAQFPRLDYIKKATIVLP